MSTIVFDQVSKIYPGSSRAVDHIDLRIHDGELLVLVGPSGCGKSTVLRMAAGLEEVSEGQIRIGERVINDVPPQHRNVAMVFQNYALYPHMTVRGNLEFPLRMQRLPRAEIAQRVQQMAEMLNLTPLLDRRPEALSGGQRQRVAMGRAIVRDADVFLMDEPLSNLDAKLRVQIRSEIAALQARLGITTIYVTHDQVEAMTLGQRVAVMREGRLQQVATPQVLYQRPANIFVAGFVGSPGMNVLRALLESVNDTLILRLGQTQLVLPKALLAYHPDLDTWVGNELLVGIHPEAIMLSASDGTNTLPARVRATESLGHATIMHFTCDVTTIATTNSGLPDGAAEKAPNLIAVLPGHQSVRTDDAIRLRIDTNCLHFFTLSGEAIN